MASESYFAVDSFVIKQNTAFSANTVYAKPLAGGGPIGAGVFSYTKVIPRVNVKYDGSTITLFEFYGESNKLLFTTNQLGYDTLLGLLLIV